MNTKFVLPKVSYQASRSEVQKAIICLLNEKVPAIIIEDFFDEKDCANIVTKAWQHDFYWFKKPSLGRIGATLAQFHSEENGEEIYFGVSEQINKVRDWLLAESGDPLKVLSQLLFPYWETSIAFDEKIGKSYTAGMIQAQLNQGNVHTDKVSYETAHWSIGQIVEKQFSSVLYLQTPEIGGELELYNRQWREKDISLAFSSDPKIRLGVNESLVNGVEKIVYEPKVGDMLLLNTSFYHRVMLSEGEKHRIGAMSFLGVTKDNKIVYFM